MPRSDSPMTTRNAMSSTMQGIEEAGVVRRWSLKHLAPAGEDARKSGSPYDTNT